MWESTYWSSTNSIRTNVLKRKLGTVHFSLLFLMCYWKFNWYYPISETPKLSNRTLALVDTLSYCRLSAFLVIRSLCLISCVLVTFTIFGIAIVGMGRGGWISQCSTYLGFLFFFLYVSVFLRIDILLLVVDIFFLYFLYDFLLFFSFLSLSLSLAHPSVHTFVCLFVCKVFAFSFSSPETQVNLN